MAAIDYSAGPRITNVGAHTVYTRAVWSDVWTAQPNLTCVECQWTAAPDFNSAILIWKTGAVIVPGNTTPTTFGAFVGRGYFVKIDWVCDDASLLRWVGYVDASTWPTEAFGDQQITCYGLERALALTPIADAVWLDESVSPAEVKRTGEPVDFNLPERNRAFTPVSGTLHAFAAEVPTGAPLPRSWSSRQILEYLLTYHLPTNTWGVSTIPWAINQLTQLPDWDAPAIETRNRTVWDVITDLVSANQQLGLTFGSDGTTAYLRVFSHLASALDIDGQIRLANPNQHTIVFAPDAYTEAEFADRGGGYDQVICRGARRISITTLSVPAGDLVPDWTDDQQTEYETGALNELQYPFWNKSERRARNDQVRAKPELNHVYTRFRLADLQDWATSYGLQGAFPDNPTPRRVRILDTLPISKTEPWHGAIDTDWYDGHIGRPALVVVAKPDFPGESIDLTRSRSGEAVGIGEWPNDFLATVEALGTSLQLHLSGAPNHAIAGADFTPLAEDTTDYGGLDYLTLAITVAIEEDRFCQAAYPVTAPAANIVRRLLVECGESYQQIYVVPVTTVAGLDPGGIALESEGGYLRDDTAKLAALAQVIAAGATLTRKQVSWRSRRRISVIAVGDLVTSAGGATINAPVVRMRLIAPESVGQTPSLPIQEFQTG